MNTSFLKDTNIIPQYHCFGYFLFAVLVVSGLHELYGITVIHSIFKRLSNGDEKLIGRAVGRLNSKLEFSLDSRFKENEQYRIQTEFAGETFNTYIDSNTMFRKINIKEDEELMIQQWDVDFDLFGTKKSSVSGIVIDGASTYGKKLNAAEVSIQLLNQSEEKKYAKTINGKFMIENCIPGVYIIDVKKEGYVPYQQILLVDEEMQGSSECVIELVPKSDQVGGVKGIVSDSITTRGIHQITMKVRQGYYNYGDSRIDDIIMIGYTDLDGNYCFENLSAGYYCVEVVDESDRNNKYTVAYFNFIVRGGKVDINPKIFLSQEIERGKIRIVLQWGKNPTDLDTHVFFSEYRKELYFYNKEIYDNGQLVAILDRDVKEGEGPEVVTIDTTLSGDFIYYVHNYFGNSFTELANSKATVWLYRNGYPSKMFTVPLSHCSYDWRVFHYDSQDDRIIAY